MIVNILKIFFAIFLFLSESVAVYRLLDSQTILNKKRIIISTICWSILCYMISQPIYSSVATIIMFLGFVISFSYLFQISLVKSVIASGVAYLIMALGDLMGVLIFNIFLKFNYLRDSAENLILGNFFVIIFLLLFTNCSFYKNKVGSLVKKVNDKNEKNIILFVILAIISISLIDLQFSFTNIKFYDLLVFLVPLIILFILLFLYILERNKLEVLNEQYEILFNHATSLESWLENDRLSYHEYKNQLAYIRSIIEEKEAIQYIDSILQESFDNSSFVDTQIVNIPKGGMKGVIFYKLIQAQRKNIQTCISISPKMKKLDVGKNIEMSKTLCRILGILLDNAIDAAAESDERKISLEMYILDCNVIFVIMNTFKGQLNVNKMSEKGYTTKGFGHGNGLNYVQNIISKSNNYSIETGLIGKYFIKKIIVQK